ncbi:hypothetical protein [Luethyella okanaganae]|uniref:Uncharacterized protein n=1 Tax=Luethyella okanaganae TaxID=69372 RepID=A0ABW1VFU1_9MICO
MSGAVRHPLNLGIVRRIAQPGSRRDRYELPDGPWYAASVGKDTAYVALAQLAESGVVALGWRIAARETTQEIRRSPGAHDE